MDAERAAVLADLAPQGHIRVAINHGNPVLAHRHPITGEPQGVSVDLAGALGLQLGIPVRYVSFDAAGQVVKALQRDAWDVAFLAIDPLRAEQIAFTAAYVVIEGSYLVPSESPLRSIDDVDRPGVRIAVGRGAAYDLFLTRSLAHAELVRADTSAGAVAMFTREGLEAAAGVRQPLLAYAAMHPGYRVIEGRFTAIHQAMATPKGRQAGLAFLAQFIEDAKRRGVVRAALERHGQTEAAVAPAA